MINHFVTAPFLLSYILSLCFFQFFQEELHIIREIRAFCLKSTAHEENRIRTVSLVHILEKLPAHAARRNGEYGAEAAHHFRCAFADLLAGIDREGEPSAEAGKDGSVSADQAGELSIIAEGGHAGIFRKNERAGATMMPSAPISCAL